MDNMTVREATGLTRHYYSHRAFAGDMDGYTADELVEWSAQTAAEFMRGELTEAHDVQPFCDDLCY